MRKLFFRLPAFLLFVMVLAYMALAGGFYWTYQQFTDELRIAQVTFRETGKGTHYAYVVGEKDPIGNVEIFGDQFRIDARFMKMKYWSQALGLKSRYSLDRIQGRYSDINDENTKPNIAYTLSEESTFENLQHYGLSFFIDTEFGSSAYAAIDTSSVFNIYKTQSGLIIRRE